MYVVKKATLNPDQSRDLEPIAYLETKGVAIWMRDNLTSNQRLLDAVISASPFSPSPSTAYEVHTIEDPSMVLDGHDLYTLYQALTMVVDPENTRDSTLENEDGSDSPMLEAFKDLLDRVLEKAPQD